MLHVFFSQSRSLHAVQFLVERNNIRSLIAMPAPHSRLLVLSSLLLLPTLIEPFLGAATGWKSPPTVQQPRTKSSCAIMSEKPLEQGVACTENSMLADAPATLLSEVGREARERPGVLERESCLH